MSATIRLPRMLADAANVETRHQVEGDTVASAFESLFQAKPGLRNHVLDEKGAIRPHVSVFVSGFQSDLEADVPEGAEIRIINAVSGGSHEGLLIDTGCSVSPDLVIASKTATM